MGKSFLVNIPHLHAKSQAESSAWPKMPALWATWRPGKLAGNELAACLARGKRYLSKGISRENLEAAGAPGKEVVSRNYQHCSPLY